jgi:hypothetical protein
MNGITKLSIFTRDTARKMTTLGYLMKTVDIINHTVNDNIVIHNHIISEALSSLVIYDTLSFFFQSFFSFFVGFLLSLLHHPKKTKTTTHNTQHNNLHHKKSVVTT